MATNKNAEPVDFQLHACQFVIEMVMLFGLVTAPC